jgi:hypothetical protein
MVRTRIKRFDSSLECNPSHSAMGRDDALPKIRSFSIEVVGGFGDLHLSVSAVTPRLSNSWSMSWKYRITVKGIPSNTGASLKPWNGKHMVVIAIGGSGSTGGEDQYGKSVRVSGTGRRGHWGRNGSKSVKGLVVGGAPDDAGVSALVELGVNDKTVLGGSDNSESGFDCWVLRVVGGRPSVISGGRSNILLKRQPELELQDSDVVTQTPCSGLQICNTCSDPACEL